MPRHIFLTGMPGVGKTTCLVETVASLRQGLPSLSLRGFTTRECRLEGRRIGFDICVHDPSDGGTNVVPLARVGNDGEPMPKVGKYSVRVDAVREHMVGALRSSTPGRVPHLTVIDEVGKMELLCPDFFPAVWNHLDAAAATTTIGTLPIPKNNQTVPEVERVLGRNDVMVLLVTRTNRDPLTRDLTAYLKSRLSNQQEGLVEPPTDSLEQYRFQRP